MLLNERQVTHDELLTRVEEMKEQGYRFVTATCVQSGDTMELIYHFDRELTLAHLRLTTQRDATIHSISPIYGGAYFIENEVHDLYGLKFAGLVIDYAGKFILSDDAPMTPMIVTDKKEGK